MAHSLDLVFTETIGETKMIRCNPGHLFIRPLYHRMPTFIEKGPDAKKKEIKYRKLGMIDPKVFGQQLHLEGYEELSLDSMVDALDNNLLSVIDKLAPIKSKTILVRATNPWFNNVIRDQKKKMRKQEKKWRKYKMESNLKAFKLERINTDKC